MTEKDRESKRKIENDRERQRMTEEDRKLQKKHGTEV